MNEGLTGLERHTFHFWVNYPFNPLTQAPINMGHMSALLVF